MASRDAAAQLQGVALQPSGGTPNGGFIQAARPQSPTYAPASGLGEFLGAMGKLGANVQELGIYEGQRENFPRVRKEAAAKAWLQTAGKSAKDVNAINTEGMSHVDAMALNQRKGIVNSESLAQQALDEFNKDPLNSDPQAIYNKYLQMGKEAVGGDASAIRGLSEGPFGDLLGKMQGAKAQAQNSSYQADKEDTVQAAARVTIKDAIAKSPDDPDAALKALNQFAKENRDFMNMPYAQQSKLFAGLGQQFAEAGDQKGLAAIGNFDRGGKKLSDTMGEVWQNYTTRADNVANGKAREDFQPTLEEWQQAANDGALSDDARKQMETYNKANSKLFPNSQYNAILKANESAIKAKGNQLAAQQIASKEDDFYTANSTQIQQAARDGRLGYSEYAQDHEVGLANGKTTTVPGKNVVAMGIEKTAQADADAAEATLRKNNPNASPAEISDARQQARIKLYDANHDLPQDVKVAASGLLGRSVPGDKGISDADREGARALINLRRNAPGLYDSGDTSVIKTEKDKAFVNAMDADLSYGSDLDHAIQSGRAARDRYGTTAPIQSTDLKTATDAVIANLGGTRTWGQWFSGENAAGSAAATDDARSRGILDSVVKELYSHGVTGQALTDQATAVMKHNTTTYNGRVVDLRGLSVSRPEDANPMFDAATSRLLKVPNNANITPDQVTWVRSGPDRFTAYTTDGMPIADSNMSSAELKQMHGQKVESDRKAQIDTSLKTGQETTRLADKARHPYGNTPDTGNHPSNLYGSGKGKPKDWSAVEKRYKDAGGQ